MKWSDEMANSWSKFFVVVKREAGGSSETLVNSYQITRCQYAEEQNLRNVIVWLRVSGQECVVAVRDAFVFWTPWGVETFAYRSLVWMRLGVLCSSYSRDSNFPINSSPHYAETSRHLLACTPVHMDTCSYLLFVHFPPIVFPCNTLLQYEGVTNV